MKSLGHCKVSGVTEEKKDEESWSLQGLWSDRNGKREEVSVTAGVWSDRNGIREVVLVNAKEGIIKIKKSNELSLLFLSILHALS